MEPAISRLLWQVFDLSRWKMVMRNLGNFEHRGERLLTVDSYAGRLIAGRLDGSLDVVFENGWVVPDEAPVRLQVMNATELTPRTFRRLEGSCGEPNDLMLSSF